MRRRLFPSALLTAFAILFAACTSPITNGNLEDQIATSVAATLQAQGLPAQTEPTAAPLDGEVLPQGSYGDCANSGQLSLAYISSGSVWLWVQGGAKTQLTDSGDAWDLRISEDGCRIAYAKAVPNPAYDPDEEFPLEQTVNELWVVRSDGSGNQKLAGVEFYANLPSATVTFAYTLYQFEWRPGSHQVAFSTRMMFSGPGLTPTNDIHLINADTLTSSAVRAPGEGGWFTFSHSGEQLAFSTAESINLINADGSNPRLDLVTFPLVLTYSEYFYTPPIHWLEDDTALMVAIPPEDGLAPATNGVFPQTSIWQAPLDGSPGVQLASVQNVFFAMEKVQFSPNGSRIGYLRPVDPTTNQGELVVSNSDGSAEAAPLQLPEVVFEVWAADSNRYIYSYRDPGFHLFLGSADSPNVQPISTLTAFEAEIADIVWVEGSTFILELKGPAGTELSVMDTSGSGALVETFVDFHTPFDFAY